MMLAQYLKEIKYLPSKKIEYYGQPIFAVIATSNILAKKASLKAKIIVEELKTYPNNKRCYEKKNLMYLTLDF